MSISLAQKSDFDVVKEITHTTINEIYPHYYSNGAVAFFLNHHSDENMAKDISRNCVFLCYDLELNVVGTVTIKKNEICRLFVLPQYQGNGYGKELMDFAETEIAKCYDEIILDASLSAKSIYLKRGYKEIEYHTVRTENNDYLCYDIMKKSLSNVSTSICYDGKYFVPRENTENGEVDGNTLFAYHQKNNMIWADYSGGEIIKGHLIGTVAENGELDFYYQHMNEQSQVRVGVCHSVPNILEDGKIELSETWQWLNGDKSQGISSIREK